MIINKMQRKTLFTFLMGVLTSLVATFIWWSVTNYVANKYRQLESLNGYWLEEIPKSTDRRYSIGKFYYDKESQSYHYDGANYNNDGTLFCTWESTNFNIDFNNKKIYYIFQASIKDGLYNLNYGFGVINFENKNGTIIPTTGFYRETLIDAEPYSHDFKRLNNVIKLLNIERKQESLEDFHSIIIKSYHEGNALLNKESS